MAVGRGAFLHGGVDVGDRDLVEIAGIVVVDRSPEQAAKIANGRASLGGGPGDGVRLREDRRGEVRPQAALDHRPACDAPELVSADCRGPIHLDVRPAANTFTRISPAMKPPTWAA